MAFTGMLCRFAIYYDSLLLEEDVPTTQGGYGRNVAVSSTMMKVR